MTQDTGSMDSPAMETEEAIEISSSDSEMDVEIVGNRKKNRRAIILDNSDASPPERWKGGDPLKTRKVEPQGNT